MVTRALKKDPRSKKFRKAAKLDNIKQKKDTTKKTPAATIKKISAREKALILDILKSIESKSFLLNLERLFSSLDPDQLMEFRYQLEEISEIDSSMLYVCFESNYLKFVGEPVPKEMIIVEKVKVQETANRKANKNPPIVPKEKKVDQSSFVYINGAKVDIKGILILILDSGIDLEFLDALPDELRLDVLAQYVRDQQNADSANKTADIPVKPTKSTPKESSNFTEAEMKPQVNNPQENIIQPANPINSKPNVQNSFKITESTKRCVEKPQVNNSQEKINRPANPNKLKPSFPNSAQKSSKITEPTEHTVDEPQVKNSQEKIIQPANTNKLKQSVPNIAKKSSKITTPAEKIDEKNQSNNEFQETKIPAIANPSKFKPIVPKSALKSSTITEPTDSQEKIIQPANTDKLKPSVPNIAKKIIENHCTFSIKQ